MSTSFAETAAEIAAVSNSVDKWRELIAESDRLVNEIELLNHCGRKMLTEATAGRIAGFSTRVLGRPLPEGHEAGWRVQAALDHLFDDLQPVLFERDRVAHGRARIYPEPDEEPES